MKPNFFFFSHWWKWTAYYPTTHKNYQNLLKKWWFCHSNVSYRALRGYYGLHNCPPTQAIGKIVKKFEDIGVVTNIERPVVHYRFACSADNIAIVSKSVAKDPNVLDSSSFSRIRAVLRHFLAYFAFRSTPTSI